MAVYIGPVLASRRPLADPVWHSLQRFNTYASATPAAFEAKAQRFPAALRSSVAVIVIDVLRATTTLTAVGATGVNGIVVAVKPTDGSPPFIAPTTAFGPWVGGGEENGEPIPGGCIANSPVSVSVSLFEDRYLKFVSTNGARAIARAEAFGAGDIYIACLRNIEVTVEAAIANGAQRVLFVAGGFYESATLEDSYCIGLGVAHLIRIGFADELTLCDEAEMSLRVAEGYPRHEDIVPALARRQVAQLLTVIGHGADVAAVVTGAGVDPDIWRRMHRTVLRHEQRANVGLFVPTHKYQQGEAP